MTGLAFDLQAIAARHAAPRRLPPWTVPALVMAPPTYLSTAVSNNVFMAHEHVDKPRAMMQWTRIKTVLEAFGRRVGVIPAAPGNQDQAYTANVAAAVNPFIVLARYSAPGRAGEVPPAYAFFRAQGYRCVQPPFAFEGEADFKRVTDDLYVGGYGQFSDPKAGQWIAQQCGVQVVPVEEISAKLYHLDCSLMVLEPGRFLAAEEGLSKPSLDALAKVGEVLLIPKGFAETGVTNGIVLREKHIYLTGTFQQEVPAYRKALEWLQDFMAGIGYAVVPVDTDAFQPSAADLSCCVCHVPFAPGGA